MIRGVIFTHADLCHALREAVNGLLGPQEELIGLSNSGLSSEEMLPALRQAVGNAGDGVFVFTALFGGSCWQTTERLRREDGHIRHLTGVNLPMLLAFANKRETMGLDALLETLAEYGRKGIHP